MAELNIAQPMRFQVDVKTGLVEQPQRESLMKGDKKANWIIAEIVNGGVPRDITGVTVKGKFCRPPDLDEIELSGTAEGNLAIVQLTDACYAQSGNYQATVSLVFDDVERTVLFISGDVLKSGSGNAASDEETGGSGSTGSGLPSGGTEGQVLVKVSSAEGDALWKTLTAADVGARPDNWMPTAEETGALPSGGTAANANQLNGKDADQYLTVDKVVNNFTATEEGFVADARALKVLNDKFTKSTFVFTPSSGITVTTSRLVKNEFMADVSLELKADAEIAAYASLGSFNIGITGIFGVASVGGAAVDFYTSNNSLFFRKAISADGVARVQFTCII